MRFVQGGDVQIRATGYVESYLDRVKYQRENDSKFNPFPRDEFIPNLIIAVMRESEAVNILDRLNIPAEYHCPTRLNALAQSKNKNAPKVPIHTTIVAFADDGLFDLLEKHREMLIKVEEYYADVYEFLVHTSD